MIPAAKHLDPLLGIDIHIVQPPGPVPPVPIPHPHIGMVLDPIEYVPYIGGTVTVGGLLRAQAGTAGLSFPHCPIGGMFVKPPGNESEIFMGSSTVAVDGDAMSYQGLLVLSCQDIGMPGPPRAKGAPPKSLVLPSSVVLSIPVPVEVGGAPTISLFALGFRFGMAALGRGLKKLKALAKQSAGMQALSRRIHKAAARLMTKLGIPPSLQKRIHKSICNVTGHPVDTVSGMVFTEALDFAFDGPLQLRWDRDWYSNSNHDGELGHGWHHPFDMHLWEDHEVVIVRLDDGRWIPFARPEASGAYNHHERLRLYPSLATNEHGQQVTHGYRLQDPTGVSWVFTPSKPTFVGRRTLRGFTLARVEDRCGNSIELDRDYAGVLKRIRDSTGREIDFHHDARRRITTIWGPHRHDPTQRMVLVRYVYDAAGDLTEAHDAAGHVTRYAYEDHLLVTETDRAGMTYFFEWLGQSHEARCLRTWGDGGLFARVFRYEPGKTTWVDSLGAEHIVEFDANNRVVREHDPHRQMQMFEYDHEGALIRSVDLDGRETIWTYDSLARVVAITEPGNLTTRFAYANPVDRDELVVVVYPDGSKRIREYDDRGCMTAEIEPDGTRWTYEVDARGLLRRTLGPDDVLGYLWSARGELVGFELPSGMIHFDLDGHGDVIREHDTDGFVTEYDLDEMGRVVAARSPSGQQIRYTLDPEGRIISVETAVSTEIIERDRAGRERASIDADGRRTSYRWDTENRLLEVVDARGRSHRFVYDGNDWPTEVSDPIGRRTRIERDPSGHVLCQTEVGVDGSERAIHHDYDQRGRLAAVRHSDGYVRRIRWDKLDRIVGIDDGELSITRKYDRRGQITREQIGEFAIESAWDGEQLRARTYPEGRRISLEYTPELAPARIVVDGREVARYEYGADDREIRRSGGVVVARRMWTRDGRLGAHWLEPIDATLEPGFRREYSYDASARTIDCRDARFGDERYELGPSGDLWRVQRSAGSLVDLLELRRDAVGHLAGTPGADDGALTASGAVANEHVWKWDAEGRLIEKSSEDGSRRWRLKWDAESHLVSVGIERDGRAWASVQLRYDGLARLVRKRVTRHDGWHSETYWLWDGECMAGERTRTWTPDAVEPELMVRDYLLDPVDLRPLAIFEQDGALLVECDQAKAARAAVDERGRIVWHIDFDAFGRPRGGDLEQLGRVPFRFLGQLADVDLGFHYNYHRWYDPDLGAYLTSDPLGLAGGLHTWNYVPSPFDAWDPFGLIHHNDPGHYVYGLYSPEPPKPGQKPYYVGITNDLDKRGAQHQASGRLVEEGRPYRLDGPVKYGTARGYEQAYIEHFETKTGTRGALMGSPEKPLRGKARGNRANSFDINNTKRWAPRHKAFCKARKEKLKSLKPSCS